MYVETCSYNNTILLFHCYYFCFTLLLNEKKISANVMNLTGFIQKMPFSSKRSPFDKNITYILGSKHSWIEAYLGP